MRQEPGTLGVVQRQVTARPVQTLQGFQTQARIDPNSNRFADGLEAFLGNTAKVAQQHRAEQQDAEAAIADIGMDGYNTAMQGALKANPDLFDRPDELAKLDSEMRTQYLGQLTDTEIKDKVKLRLDTWLGAQGQTYQFAKADKQRTELGTRTLQLSVQKLEEARKAGSITEEQAVDGIKSVTKHLRTSPTFQFGQDKTEELIKGLQDVYAKDGTHRVLLAKAFMDDPDVTPELQLALQADHAEGLAMTKLEKEQKQFEILSGFEPLVQAGRLTEKQVREQVDGGLLTAEAGMGLLSRQRTLLEQRIKDAQAQQNAASGNWDAMTPKERRKVLDKYRTELNPTQYKNWLRNNSITDPVLQSQAERAFNTPAGPVTTPDEIPAAWRDFQQEAKELRSMGMLEQQIGPEKALKAHLAAALQEGGKTELEAYNASLTLNPYAKMSDVDRMTMNSFKTSLRSDLGQGDYESPETDLGAYYALHLSKTGLAAAEATERAAEFITNAYHITPAGPVPKAVLGNYIAPANFDKNVEFAVAKVVEQEAAQGYEVDPDDVRLTMLPDGSSLFRVKGSDRPIVIPFNLMTANTPDVQGQQTVTGARQEAEINGKFGTTSNTAPYTLSRDR